MRALRQALAAAALMAASVVVVASPVQYHFTSALAPVAPNAGANFSGYVEFDSSLLAPNAVISVASFTDWAFTWGNDFSYGIGSDSFDPALSTFVLGAGLEAASVDLCFSGTGICNTSEHPVARVLTNLVAATYNAAGGLTAAEGSWSGPVAQVPEPTTIALAGIALLGLGWRRNGRTSGR